MIADAIPLTVIAGYLGAGKTYLINRLLSASQEPIGVCVNDFGEINIDAGLIQNNSGTTLELTNGCVCCQLTDDLGTALEELRSANITRVIIEASGVALPEKIAAYGRNWPGYALHKTYTLVDASNIAHWLGDKYVGSLVASQIEQADELLITKLDLVDQTEPQQWPWLRQSRADWQLLPNEPLATAWVAALFAPHISAHPTKPTEPQGVPHAPNLSATCLACDEPINSLQLRAFLKANPHIVRAKGWFTDTQQQQHLLQHVATQTNIQLQSDQPTQSNGLVFLHHKSTELDLSPLSVLTDLNSQPYSKTQ